MPGSVALAVKQMTRGEIVSVRQNDVQKYLVQLESMMRVEGNDEWEKIPIGNSEEDMEVRVTTVSQISAPSFNLVSVSLSQS